MEVEMPASRAICTRPVILAGRPFCAVLNGLVVDLGVLRQVIVEKRRPALGTQAGLLLPCSSCFVERQHDITLAEQTSHNWTWCALSKMWCYDSTRVNSGPQPGRTIANRLKRAISFSARHAAK